MLKQITHLLSEVVNMSKEHKSPELPSQKRKSPVPPRNTSSDHYNRVVEKYQFERGNARDSRLKRDEKELSRSQQKKKKEEEDEELD